MESRNYGQQMSEIFGLLEWAEQGAIFVSSAGLDVMIWDLSEVINSCIVKYLSVP